MDVDNTFTQCRMHLGLYDMWTQQLAAIILHEYISTVYTHVRDTSTIRIRWQKPTYTSKRCCIVASAQAPDDEDEQLALEPMRRQGVHFSSRMNVDLL